MTKLIGWLFFLSSPLVAGLLFVLGLVYITEWDFSLTMGLWCLIWLILFVAWFDGSKYQKIL